jgi:hypothetical protein
MGIIVFQEWSVTDLKHTVLHWDLYAQADTEKLARYVILVYFHFSDKS